jgi:putative toxin-antitoxin system antitoxin component (TIGR02293 family)
MKSAAAKTVKRPAAKALASMPGSARVAQEPAVYLAARKPAKPPRSPRPAKGQVLQFERVYLAPPHERIDAIKLGVPAAHVGELARLMHISKDALIDTLRMSRATVNRWARAHKSLPPDESERVLGVEYLIGQVENMVKESGDATGFDAAQWVSGWLHAPLPALGGRLPATYLDTIEGQKLVSRLLAMTQSGAYA